MNKTADYYNSRELGLIWCEQLGHVHSVVWLHDTLCEVVVTDEPGRGNYVPSGVPDVVIIYGANEIWNQFHLVQDFTALFIFFQGDRGV